MKKTIVGIVAVLIALMAIASAQNPPYKQVAKFLIGGDSGWDYITYDPELTIPMVIAFLSLATTSKLSFASNGKGTLTIVRQGAGSAYEVAGNVPTGSGARTMALDPKTHYVYLPSAELGPPAKGERWPSVKPGTFEVLAYAPSQD